MELLKGEGDTKTVVKTRRRRECDCCGEPATVKHTYLNERDGPARRNPASSAYGRDDCSWCSDHDLFQCPDCDNREDETNVPHGFRWCSSFNVGRMPHLFLYWDEREVDRVEERPDYTQFLGS